MTEPASPSPVPSPTTSSRLPARRHYELTPAELMMRRRNRRWILLIAVPALLVGAAALIAALLADSSSPRVRPVFVPAGYKAVTDGYFGYAVPTGWSTNDLFSDSVGDLDTSGPDGWVAEHLAPQPTAPTAASTPPPAFRSFGAGRPSPFQLGRAQPIQIPGTQVAYRYSFTRPGGFTAVAIDAWRADTSAQVWMLVAAPPAVTSQILATLKG